MQQQARIDRDFHIARGEDRLPENFPELSNLSAGFFYDLIARPAETLPPEFVYVPLDREKSWTSKGRALTGLAISHWNTLWEAGHLRSEFVPQVFHRGFPKRLEWLTNYEHVNLYLIPDDGSTKYDALGPLFHLLPLKTVGRFALPALRRGLWPPSIGNDVLLSHIEKGFDEKLSIAFANHIWPILSPGSKMRGFSKNDPIVILAHNLNFWLPSVYKLVEDRLRQFPRVAFDCRDQEHLRLTIQSDLPQYIHVDRPLCGGVIWRGEEEAWEATKELVEVADRHERLRAIIDAVRTNRIEDDFSNLWSYAKEDFERKLYHKRSKIRVTFVELDEAEPVHAPTSELHENVLWEDFIVLLTPKERRIVVCLKNGVTRASEISRALGYANHSAVSKTLKRIRQKAKGYFEL